MKECVPCPVCGTPTEPLVLAEAHQYAFWQRPDGACPACVQQTLLQTLLDQGDEALHASIQSEWPLDTEAAFGTLPTPLRLHADPRFSGRGVTLAVVDTGFYPHPDLVQPRNRIRAWVDVGGDTVHARRFEPDEMPGWPAWDGAHEWHWHGLMASVVAAGNGFLSHGLYRGLASEADLVLIQVRDRRGRITNDTIYQALHWLLVEGSNLNVRVINLSVGGDPVHRLAGNAVDEAIASLVEAGITVVAAAGNDGHRHLAPPATAPYALTIGGLDDHNMFDHADVAMWHSNYGVSSNGALKPEMVAPSIWVAAPLLPGSEVAREARQLFSERLSNTPDHEARIRALKLITPHYQHVEGTSFAAPLVASTVTVMIEANPSLTPRLIRDVLKATSTPIPGVSVERQGAGALEAGQAVAQALCEHHGPLPRSPNIRSEGVSFTLHDHHAKQVRVLGSWNGWRAPGLIADRVEEGFWQTRPLILSPGRYAYKFLLDGVRWLDDPANPAKVHDGTGGFNSMLRV